MSSTEQEVITKNEEDVLQAFLASTRQITNAARMGRVTIGLIMDGFIQRDEDDTIASTLETLGLVEEALATLNIFIAFGDSLFASEEMEILHNARAVHVAYRDALVSYIDFLTAEIEKEQTNVESASIVDANSSGTGNTAP